MHDGLRQGTGMPALAYDEINLRHTMPGHPEHEGRLRATMALLEETGLLQDLYCTPPRMAVQADLARVHSGTMLRQLAQAGAAGRDIWLDGDTYLNPHSWPAALRAAGGTIQLVETVLAGTAANGLALVRPPGHHATPDRAMGFCLLNNAAIAARWAQACAGIERVLLFDFDVHHGNGTQDVFYADPSVLFISLHQSPLYPMTGHRQETGRGQGLGTTCNMPLPPGTGDSGWLQVMDRILVPVIESFAPQLILVSAGFDGHWMDPLSNMNLTLSGYAAMLRRLLDLGQTLCDGRLAVVLEGGYQLEVLSHCVHNVLQALRGRDLVLDPFGASGHADTDISRVLADADTLWGMA